ncbi:acetylxylan esterase [Microbacterium hydrocarbonoxydans]|uniref:acetylxylan esterase n=1 Tax=Microbacterium hydrocarbonoxydans TaxID=273678 RepID=UPI00203F2161|nr:acetylxylan esterase [Microbacterium hydrocarbonoxydans]MCM3781141.1 acetylxylan esterase [Microbacterium hydrocarbonoxydans]
MPRFDLDPEQLRAYRPDVAEPADFDEFWSTTLAASRAKAEPARLTRVESPLRTVEVFDVTFSGYDGDPISGWLTRPAGAHEPLPVVVEYNGYNGGRGLPHEHLAWAASGYAHLFMDTRGQGSGWGTGGSTPDPHGTGPSAAGYMTRGILDPADYYYRRVFTDGVLAVDAVRGIDGLDPQRVAVTGTSQGGGIAIAVAGLADDLVAVMPDVPFLCHFERAVGMTGRDPYQEIVRYLSVHRDQVDEVFRTLSYFDGVNFAGRATAPALFSVALLDQVCPPSTVYAARNSWGGTADIVDYPFNEHEGGLGEQWLRQAQFLAEVVGAR